MLVFLLYFKREIISIYKTASPVSNISWKISPFPASKHFYLSRLQNNIESSYFSQFFVRVNLPLQLHYIPFIFIFLDPEKAGIQ